MSTATEVIADVIRQGTGDCETCRHDPDMVGVHLAGEIILALYDHGWRVIPAALVSQESGTVPLKRGSLESRLAEFTDYELWLELEHRRAARPLKLPQTGRDD